MNHWYYGRKDEFIRAALATGKYEPLPCGDVMNLDVRGTGRKSPLRRRIDNRGYTVIHLFDGTRRQPVLLHRVIALVFVARNEGATQVNHISGQKSDCSSANLEWVTGSVNCSHAYATGLRHPTVPNASKFVAGESHHCAKLTEQAVAEIRSRLVAKESQRSIAVAFGVSQSAVSNIARGHTWN